MDIFNLVSSRRSVKPELFEGVTIGDSALIKLLEVANWAPTHALTEPWRFKIFKEKGLAELGLFEAEYYRKTTPPEKFMIEQYKKNQERPLQCAAVLAICMHRVREGKIIPEWEEIASVACAVQNIWLACTAEGWAAYWGSGGSSGSEELKEWLGLAEADRQMGFFYIGKYSGSLADGKRKTDILAKLL